MGRLWMRLHGLTFRGRWVQHDSEVIPEYVVATWLGLDLMALAALVLG